MVSRIGGQSTSVSIPSTVEDDNISTQKSDAIHQEVQFPDRVRTDGAAAFAEGAFSGAAMAAELASRLISSTSTEPPPSISETPIATTVKEPLLFNPSKGPAVLELQKQINEWRVRNGKEPIKEDEVFGPKTEAAVKEFQKATGLKADGLVGPLTRERLKLENDKNFQSLDADMQQKVRTQLNTHSKNPAARANITNLVTSDDFGKIARDGQEHALDKLNEKPGDPSHASSINDAVRDRAYLETHVNFQAFDADTKAKVLEQFKNCPDKDARSNLSFIVLHSDFGKLSPEHKDLALQVHRNNPSNSEVADNLRVVISDKAFASMPDVNKTRVLEMMAKNANGPYAKSMRDLICDPKFAAMSEFDKTKALNVFENTTPAGRTAFMQLLGKEVNGSPILSSRGVGGSGPTLLDNLNRLSTTPLDPSVQDPYGLPEDRTKVTEDLLKELSAPSNHLDQGNRGTCTVTSMSNTLCEKNPAEYARIVTDLATTGYSTLANGDRILVPIDGFGWDGSGRSVSERLFQSAVMNYGKGGTYTNFSPGDDGLLGTVDDVSNKEGLSAQQNQKVLEGLYNKKMERYAPPNRQDLLNRTTSEIQQGNGPVFTGFTWGAGAHANHAVEVMKIEGGRVYYRNPWGPNAATETGGPATRKTEDASTGLESITVEEYLTIANDIIVPKKEVK